MAFARNPFLIITPIFIFGILIADSFRMSSFLILSALGLLLIVYYFLFRSNSRLRIAGSFILLTCIALVGVYDLNGVRDEAFIPDVPCTESAYLIHINEIEKDTTAWRKSICQVLHEKEEIGEVLLFIKDPKPKRGDFLVVQTTLAPIQNKGNPGEFNAKSYWNNQNIYGIGFVAANDYKYVGYNDPNSLQSFFLNIQESLGKMLGSYLDGTNLSIAKALILGDKSTLSNEERNSFANAGAMHVLAVSGLHVGILLFLLIFILKQFPKYISKHRATLVAILIIWGYAAITGFSPSVIRASFMFSLIAIGQYFGKRADGLNILLFSAFVLLLINPLLIYDIGFQLSYLAMLGIILFYKKVSELFWIRNKWLRKIWEGTGLGIAAQTFTVPLSLYYFHQFPNYFMLSNVVVMVFAGMILSTGLILIAVNKLWLLGNWIGMVLAGLIAAMYASVDFIQQLPGAVAKGFDPSINLVIVIYLLILLFLIRTKWRWWRRILVVFLLALVAFIQFNRHQNIRSNEVVIMNNNSAVLLVKYNDQIICFYETDHLKQARYLTETYAKIHPGKIEYDELTDDEITLTTPEKLKISRFENGYSIQLKNQNLFLRTGYGNGVGDLVIDLPYIESTGSSYNLKNGAFVVPFD